MRGANKIVAAIAAFAFAGVAVTATFAQQVRPIGGEGGKPIPPHPVRTLPPLATPTPASGGVAPSAAATPAASGNALKLPRLTLPTSDGQQVPLTALAPLPPKSASNTAYFGTMGQGRHTMSATGADINYFTDITNSSCASAVGTLIPVGCDIVWQSGGLSGTDTWQDYYVSAGSTTATTSGGTYTGTSGAQHTSPNLTAGTWVFGTYDKTASKWISVIYVSANSTTVFGSYADSGATIPQTQFTAANGTNVYANATGLTQGQSYVVYVESTSVNPTCTYVAPPGSVTANTLCNPNTSSGIVAVVGAQSSAAITAVWPLSSTTPTGTYSLVLYNLTTQTRLAMRQVSIKGSTATGSISLVPTAGNASLGTNWPTPPPTPYSATTKFAFDSTSETSDTGWTMTASGLTATHSYTYTVTDPTGAVVSGPSTGNTTASGTQTKTFTFGGTQSPSNYVGNVYTVQMYNTTTKVVDASQSFQIVGYNSLTQFKDPSTGVASTAIVLPQGSSVSQTLQFTNDGDTFYGTGNGDTISGIAFNTGGVGIWINLTDSSVTTGCGGGCQQQTVVDTNGVSWTVQNSCYGGNGANKGCTLTAYPATNGQSLAMSATLAIPNVQFNNVPGNSNCQAGCTGYTSILPTDGETWSQTNNSSSTNTVAFTNGAGNTWAGTGSVTHIGYVTSGNVYTAGKETHGYANNATNAIYTSSSPFTTPTGYADVWAITVTNNASLGTSNMTQIVVVLPTAYSPGGISTTATVDSTSPTQWTAGTGSSCSVSMPASGFCLNTAGSNGGIAPGGGSQTIYVDITPPPPGAFTYTDWTLQAAVPTQFTLTPSGSFTGFVPQTVYDSTASAGYSLNGNLITPGFSPTSEGQNTNNSVTINVTNASTAQDPNPDYLDLIAIDLPSANAFTNASSMPTGWSLLGTTSPNGTTTRYWFGLCATQYSSASGSVTGNVTACPATTEANSMIPGQTFSVTGNVQTATSNITGTMYAHGANGGGWSSGHTFSLNVTAVSATAGFSAAGGYPAAGTVTSPQTPQIGADSDSTYGNAFTYVIKNTSGSGNNITSATITIPGKDTSSVLPADGTAWTLTGTPAISGTTYGCSITSSSSATTSGTNGAINIGGGSCAITPGSALTVTFTAKAPYTVNDTYQFPTKVNSSVNASESWSTDTIVQIILAANLVISVNPSADAVTGSTPVVSCATCAFNTSTNTVDFGMVSNLQTVTGQDVVRVSVYTNAGSTVGWKLYASTNTNPANTGSPSNELLTAIDNGSNRSMPQSGVNFDQTSYAVVPTTSPGVLLMDTGTGRAATRNPFDMLMNYEISIQGGPTTPTTSVVTYTFISN
jgi:hypothetical protein